MYKRCTVLCTKGAPYCVQKVHRIVYKRCTVLCIKGASYRVHFVRDLIVTGGLMKQENYLDIRKKCIRKANVLIQKGRFSLSIQQQKIMLLLLSRIGPHDKEFHVCSFKILEFCRVCGLVKSGTNYEKIKDQIKGLCDEVIWLKSSDREGTLRIRWLEQPRISFDGGTVELRLNEQLKPYLLGLKKNFTEYPLIYPLAFRSKYSIRLYELICSLHYDEMKEYKKNFSLDELREAIGCEGYSDFRAFRRRVLDKSVSEINEHSNKTVTYEAITQGRKIVSVELTISAKDSLEAARIHSEIEHELGVPEGYMTIWDELQVKGYVARVSVITSQTAQNGPQSGFTKEGRIEIHPM